MDIKDKVVLVTGASSGIGKATAELFSRKGAKVVLAAQSIEEVKELAAKIPNSFVVIVDMTKPQEVQQMVQQTQDHYGRIDVLINNAGPRMHAPLEHIEVDDFARLMSLNVYGPLVAMQTTIPLMRKQGGGAIVNIGSGIFQAPQSITPHTTSAQSALKIMPLLNTRTEYSDAGISVSTVYPREQAAHEQKHSKRRKGSHKRQHTETVKLDFSQSVAATIVETVEKGIAVEFH